MPCLFVRTGTTRQIAFEFSISNVNPEDGNTDYHPANPTSGHNILSNVPAPILDAVLDFNLFESKGELICWSELDSHISSLSKIIPSNNSHLCTNSLWAGRMDSVSECQRFGSILLPVQLVLRELAEDYPLYLN